MVLLILSKNLIFLLFYVNSYGGLGYGSRTGYGYNHYGPTAYNSVYNNGYNNGEYGINGAGFLQRFEGTM